MNDIPEGKYTIGALMDTLTVLMHDINWDPKGVHGASTVQFIEVKACLINAKKKLKKISIREGYE